MDPQLSTTFGTAAILDEVRLKYIQPQSVNLWQVQFDMFISCGDYYWGGGGGGIGNLIGNPTSLLSEFVSAYVLYLFPAQASHLTSRGAGTSRTQ